LDYSIGGPFAPSISPGFYGWTGGGGAVYHSRHLTKNKKRFSSLRPLSHMEYVTFGDDKKGKMLNSGIIKVNDYFTLNDVTLVDKLRYNLLSVS
jgi:hypothetical protein